MGCCSKLFTGEIDERLCHNCDEGKTTLYATIVLRLHPPCAPVFHVVLQIICQAARPTWRHRIEQWEKSQARLIEDSYKCTEPYAQLYPVYVNALCPKVILQINKHRLKKYTGIQDMENGFVTTDFIESSFGYADCVFSNGGVADCVSQTGAVIGGMNGVFLSRRQQLASHIKARLKRHGGQVQRSKSSWKKSLSLPCLYCPDTCRLKPSKQRGGWRTLITWSVRRNDN